MGERLLPKSLIEVYAHALLVEREAARRFAELERFLREAGIDYLADEIGAIAREELEQYQALALGTAERELPQIAGWEYAWHFMGPAADRSEAPRTPRDALALALAMERRAQAFYIDVAEHAVDDAVCAFAVEMATDEQRHIQRLEVLLAREPLPAAPEDDGRTLAK
ncbi:MAG TPA: ferritin family protein [Burkholderiales bacterium]